MEVDNSNGFFFHPAVMSGLLGRVLRAGGVVVPSGEHIDIVHSGGHWWGCSLVEWLGQMNLTITMESLKRYALAVPSVSEVADLIDRKGVMSLECEDPESTAEIPLRVGQCWGIPLIDEELGTTSVYEILGFNPNQSNTGEAVISLLQWECPHPLAVGSVVRASNRSRSGMHRGTTSRLHYSISRLLSEAHRHSCSLVALNKERHTEHVADTWCKVTCITPRTLSTIYTPDALLDPFPEMLYHFTESTLYTDGSAHKTGSVEDFLKGKEATIATGAIVGTNDGDHYTATRVDFATTKLTPYLTELMTTMYARRRSTADIVSDCQGSLKTLQRARKGRRPKGAQGHITAAYSYPTIREQTEARWAHSHPKLNQSKNGRWTPDDFGMWLSDGVAGREMVEGTYRGKTITSLQVVDGDSLIKDFFSRGANYVHIMTSTDCGVLLQPIKEMVARRSFDKYCIRRDEYRAKALKPPKWEDCTGIFAGRMYVNHLHQCSGHLH